MNHHHGEISPFEGELFHQPLKRLLIQQSQENISSLIDYMIEKMENTPKSSDMGDLLTFLSFSKLQLVVDLNC